MDVINLNELISRMTLEEKAGLCSGFDFWHTKEIERLGIPSIMMADGPNGLRKQDTKADHLGINKSNEATCFPTGATLACSWDRNLIEKVGVALGEECQAAGIPILLGPAVNIKRSPLCGRNFEYFSEDPYLTSELAVSYINGVQSQGVGASIKHFAANNQEYMRLSVDVVVDERTLREIYLACFEGAVKRAQPWTVMCAYNRVNGSFCSENKQLLTNILREEWGYKGFVVSDWGAMNERVDALMSGLELQMPASGEDNDKKIVEAVKSAKLDVKILDRAVERLLNIIFKAAANKKLDYCYDMDKHHSIAREAARESIVLLKNQDSILPLDKKGKVAIIGSLAKFPRFQGGGSAHVNPISFDITYEEIAKKLCRSSQLTYADGYRLDNEVIDTELVSEAMNTAAKADVAVIFTGLPEEYDTEGYDRSHMRIPLDHIKLIENIAEVQPNIVVVLSNGSAVEMQWINAAKGILEVYLGGQGLGNAIADILFGDANPCGKLAETFPKRLSDNPSYLNFPGEGSRVEYREGIFVGYRYYDKKEIEPQFSFGHGLSYTRFEYTDISINSRKISDNETVEVSVKIKNIGNMAGKEIVQLYVKEIESKVIRPDKELKGFEKIYLKPDEEKTIIFELGKRAFAYYNTDIKDWCVESGYFEILVGWSSKDIVLKEKIYVERTAINNREYTRFTTVGELMDDAGAENVVKEIIRHLSVDGALLSNLKEDPKMAENMLRGCPLCSVHSFSCGTFTEDILQKSLKALNG